MSYQNIIPGQRSGRALSSIVPCGNFPIILRLLIHQYLFLIVSVSPTHTRVWFPLHT